MSLAAARLQPWWVLLRSPWSAPLLVLATLLGAGMPLAHAADEAILLIEQVSGATSVQRDGKRLQLIAGDALQEQDLIVTEGSGRMTLRLGRHGFAEVGANAEVGVERLPFAVYARDLKSIFSVSKGYFRLVWKHPQLSSSWPLYVYMAGHRISLVSGEYFFQHFGDAQKVCVAAGQMSLQTAGGEAQEIMPPSCARLAAQGSVRRLPQNPDDWVAMRQGFSTEATATTGLPPIVSVAPRSKPARSSAVPLLPATTGIAVAASAKPLVSAPPATLVTTQGWSLNIASYSEAAVAEREAARLRDAGYDRAGSQPATVNGKLWHRVRIDGYDSADSARLAAQQLKDTLGLPNIWVQKP